MNLFYWDQICRRWLGGTEEEISRFHLDYPPQETKQAALIECRKFYIKRSQNALRDALEVPEHP